MGSLRRLTRRRRRDASRLVVFSAGAGAAWLAMYLDKRRRHIARDRLAAAARRGAATADGKAQYAAGLAKRAVYETTAPLRHSEREYDDVTLARKVESELFRPADARKGSVSVNAQHGIVELRGEVERREDIEALGAAAARVDGVKDVHNLLHTPGSPPKHSPPSEPDEVRQRAQEPTASSRFAGNPATAPPADEPLVERAEAPSSKPKT